MPRLKAPRQLFGLGGVRLRFEEAAERRRWWWGGKSIRCTHGCCRWSPARCPSWAGCRPTWKLRSPPCPAAAWPSGAARWWTDPSRPAGPAAAAGCSPSPPWPGAEEQAQRVTRRKRERRATERRGLEAERQIAGWMLLFICFLETDILLPRDELATGPGCDPAFALWEPGLAPEKHPRPWVQEKAGVYNISFNK